MSRSVRGIGMVVLVAWRCSAGRGLGVRGAWCAGPPPAGGGGLLAFARVFLDRGCFWCVECCTIGALLCGGEGQRPLFGLMFGVLECVVAFFVCVSW